MKKLVSGFLIFGLIALQQLAAQFAPPAGQSGSTAIHSDSSVFVAWASAGTLQRGYVKVDEPELGFASYGLPEDAFGKADLFVVSLGDGGSVVLEFEHAIINGPGADFAVFENSFSDTFLELALVEVSSDGIQFEMFPPISNTPTTPQVDGFGTLDTQLVHNLAGKYRAMYGTPFNLDDIDAEIVDLNNIRFVRVTDVVGSIDARYGNFDANANIINDPWPTPFPSSGFDLDAIGVIYDRRYLTIQEADLQQLKVFPNPFTENLNFRIESLNEASYEVQIFDLSRKKVFERIGDGLAPLNLGFLSKGMYVIQIRNGNEVVQKLITKS